MQIPNYETFIFFLNIIIRVFGHLEKPFFLELCRFMETITLRSGHFLFKIGDPDDSIYVVQNGLLDVYITDPVSFSLYVLYMLDVYITYPVSFSLCVLYMSYVYITDTVFHHVSSTFGSDSALPEDTILAAVLTCLHTRG